VTASRAPLPSGLISAEPVAETTPSPVAVAVPSTAGERLDAYVLWALGLAGLLGLGGVSGLYLTREHR
jgi:hypothetical protein